MQRKNIKLELISPKKKTDGNEREFWDHRFLSFLRGIKTYSIPFLALPTIAALTPPDVKINITDENIEDIDFDKDIDLVGITSNTFLAPRAYEIADEFRKRGATVILGGIHASMLPKEAIQHADAVVVGEAENVWANLINDFREEKLQQFYKSKEKPILANQPIPRYDLVKNENYFMPILQTTRGCPYDCEFCSVKTFLGRKPRCKPVQAVVKEVKSLKDMQQNLFFFADDNLIGNKRHARELFRTLIPLKITFLAQVAIGLAKDEELLKLAADSGCKRVVIGFESISEANLRQMKKDKSFRAEGYMKDVEKIQSYGIEVLGSFILGCDFDDESIFEKTVNFINESNMAGAAFHLLTPYPGTELYQRFEKEDRLLHKDWAGYDNSHICFKPKLMDSQTLLNGYTWVRQQVYSYESIFERLKKLWTLWNQGNVRSWDRTSPILVNLDARDVAYSYPAAIHPTKFVKSGKKVREEKI